MARQTGTVKFFMADKGYGFITPDDGTSDLFVHQTNINCEGYRSLAEGERVEFVVETDSQSGRTKAVDVTGPNGSRPQGAPARAPGGGMSRGPRRSSPGYAALPQVQQLTVQRRNFVHMPTPLRTVRQPSVRSIALVKTAAASRPVCMARCF